MSKKSLSKQAREHAAYLVGLAGDLKDMGMESTAEDCVQAAAIISALLARLDTINGAHGLIGRALLGLEDKR